MPCRNPPRGRAGPLSTQGEPGSSGGSRLPQHAHHACVHAHATRQPGAIHRLSFGPTPLCPPALHTPLPCRGVAYDLTPYIAAHPGGNWLINLAIGRDCTALFESYHLRPEVSGAEGERGLERGSVCRNAEEGEGKRREVELVPVNTLCARHLSCTWAIVQGLAARASHGMHDFAATCSVTLLLHASHALTRSGPPEEAPCAGGLPPGGRAPLPLP